MLQAQGSRVPAPAGLFSTVAGEARGQDVIEAELGRRYTYCAVSGRSGRVCCPHQLEGCAELACAWPTSGSRPRMALPAA
jgi:hypothetical protein